MKKIAFGILLFAALSGAFAQSALQPLAVVKLNGSSNILLKDVKDKVENYQRQSNRVLTPEERLDIFNALIDQKLVLQAAKKAGITIEGSMVDQYFLADMSQRYGRQFVSEKELSDYIRQTEKITLEEVLKTQLGMTLAEYKKGLEEQLISQRYVYSQKGSELQNVAATDKEIRDFYELNKPSFSLPEMLRLFLVSVPYGSDRKAAETKINSLMADFRSGKLTVEQMRVQSKDANAGYQAGDLLISKLAAHAARLGISNDRLIKIFEEPVNVASERKDTDRDYQFYVILEKYPANPELKISDSVQPGSTTTVYDYIRANLTNQKQSMFIMQAVQDITTSLNTKENVERKKTDEELKKLFAW